MDKSETYIKMRLAAIPDLGMGIPIECPCNLIVNDVWVDSKGDWYYSTEDEVFQLERQDQLQGMVAIPKTASIPTMTQLTMFYQFWQKSLASSHSGIPYFAIFNSMEQLWLAFVMKELYSKIWDSTKVKWVKQA